MLLFITEAKTKMNKEDKYHLLITESSIIKRVTFAAELNVQLVNINNLLLLLPPIIKQQ